MGTTRSRRMECDENLFNIKMIYNLWGNAFIDPFEVQGTAKMAIFGIFVLYVICGYNQQQKLGNSFENSHSNVIQFELDVVVMSSLLIILIY